MGRTGGFSIRLSNSPTPDVRHRSVFISATEPTGIPLLRSPLRGRAERQASTCPWHPANSAWSHAAGTKKQSTDRLSPAFRTQRINGLPLPVTLRRRVLTECLHRIALLGPWAVRPRLPACHPPHLGLSRRPQPRRCSTAATVPSHPHRLVTLRERRPLTGRGQENKYSYLGIKSKLLL
jgi:hypothetical protein